MWGICNGFQVLCEAGLLPGALVRNRGLRFVCERVTVRVERRDDAVHQPLHAGRGADASRSSTAKAATSPMRRRSMQLEQNRQVVLRYVDASGRVTPEANPERLARATSPASERGAQRLRPHAASRACREQLLGGEDGLKLFQSVVAAYSGAAIHATASVAPGH